MNFIPIMVCFTGLISLIHIICFITAICTDKSKKETTSKKYRTGKRLASIIAFLVATLCMILSISILYATETEIREKATMWFYLGQTLTCIINLAFSIIVLTNKKNKGE